MAGAPPTGARAGLASLLATPSVIRARTQWLVPFALSQARGSTALSRVCVCDFVSLFIVYAKRQEALAAWRAGSGGRCGTAPGDGGRLCAEPTEVLVLLVTAGDRDEIKPYKRAAVCSGAGDQGTRAFRQRDMGRSSWRRFTWRDRVASTRPGGSGLHGDPTAGGPAPSPPPHCRPGRRRCARLRPGGQRGVARRTREMPGGRGADGRQGPPDRAPRFSSVLTGPGVGAAVTGRRGSEGVVG